MQCVTVCCSELQWVAVGCSEYNKLFILLYLHRSRRQTRRCYIVNVLQCVPVCASVLQCGAVCYSVVQCVAVCCSVVQCAAVCCALICVQCRRQTCQWHNMGAGSRVPFSQLSKRLGKSALQCVAVFCSFRHSHLRVMPERHAGGAGSGCGERSALSPVVKAGGRVCASCGYR